MTRSAFSSKPLYLVYFVSVLLGPRSVWTAAVPVPEKEQARTIDLLMPDVQPNVADSYLCYAMKVESPFYITGFQPKAKMETAHHILIYGCAKPGSSEKVWDCGEMHSDGDLFEQGPVCRSKENIIYAWAMDAPELHLPEGVGFKVGDDTSVQWIVIQVHYKDVSTFLPPQKKKDHSGVTLTITENQQPRRAGVYLLGTNGEIPPHSITYMETACSFNGPTEIHPFAFRTHAHSHGRVVSGYRVRDGEWTEIGRKSPQLPQMFYNVTQPGITVKPGDMLAARCTMVNNDNETVSIGTTSKDEMCNFYIMYYVTGDKLSESTSCFSPGPPVWNWFQLQELHPENAPLNASIIPGTTELLKSTAKFLKDIENSMEQEREDVEGLLEVLEGYRGDRNEPDVKEWNPIDEILSRDAEADREIYSPYSESNRLDDGLY